MTRRTVCALVLTSLLSVGCGNPLEQRICTREMRHGIVVEIRDAVTGEPRAALAQGAVREGAYLDSLKPTEVPAAGDGYPLVAKYAAPERAGTYSVEVRRSGYQTWTANNVVVDGDACHVTTRILRADMQPLTP